MSEKTENKNQKDQDKPEPSMNQSKQTLILEMKELLQRTQANFENYRKQTEKRIVDIRTMAARDVIVQVLPVLDNFELALKSNDNHTSEFTKGVELIYSQLFSVLENNGVKLVDKKEFDPYYHEALMKIDSKLPENTIVEELQKGFILNDKVIRHAKVKVSSGVCSEDKQCKKDNNKK